MDKLKMTSRDNVQANIEKIRQLFPNAVTEVLRDGVPTLAIDFDVLKQELSKDLVDEKEERYQFTWPDKKKSILLANTPVHSTLRPCVEESVNFDTTQNLYIEGDNLEVLKLLQETYLGKVKMIYIDPPYNTGNDFVYNDDFSMDADDYAEASGQYDEQGNRLFQNTESNGRFHTDWLNMIYPRLKVAKDLLSDDGVIFISIDDNEVDNLCKVCDEIFGTTNFEAQITYVRKTSGKQDSSNFARSTEYILVYSKNGSWDCNTIIAESNVTDRYNKSDEEGRKYRETDLRKTGNADRREDRPLMFYPFYFNEATNDLTVRQEHDEELLKRGYVEILPIKPDGSDGRWRWGYNSSRDHLDFLVAKTMPKYKEKYTIYEIDYIDKNGEIRTVKEHTFWDRKEFNSDNAMIEFKRLGFSNQLFPFPKCSALIKHIIYLANTQDGIILDFFSGSATTAHAVMQLNAEDGGNRKFILVQLPEACDEKSEAFKAGYKNICEIGKERIRRAGFNIASLCAGQNLIERQNEIAKAFDSVKDGSWKEKMAIFEQMRKSQIGEVRGYKCPVDVGFRVLKLDSSNMQDVYYKPEEYQQSILDMLTDNIKPDRTPLDLLFQVMLELGKPLSAKIEEKTIAGKKVFVVDDNDLIACFDSDVSEETVKAIAQLKPLYAVFRDSSLASDSVAVNFDQIFATYSPNTTRKVL